MKWLLLFLSLFSASAVTLRWSQNPETNVVGYILYYGTNSGSYQQSITNSGLTNVSLVISNSALFRGTNYFAVTAFDDEGLESEFSNEVTWLRRPSAPTQLQIGAAIVVEQSVDLKTWVPVATNVIDSQTAFYRTSADGSLMPTPTPVSRFLQPKVGKFGKL